MKTKKVIVHDYDPLLGHGFMRSLKSVGLEPKQEESSWNFRKRAFIELALQVHNRRLAMAFLLLLKHTDWPEKDRKKYVKLLHMEKPTREDLQKFVNTYRKDPVVEREYATATDKKYLEVKDVEFVMPNVPMKKKERVALLLQHDPYIQEQLLKAIADLFDLSLDDMISHNRSKPRVLARRIALYIFKENGLSFAHIGRILYRDHTTIIHGYKKICERKESDPEVAKIIAKINAQLVKNSP